MSRIIGVVLAVTLLGTSAFAQFLSESARLDAYSRLPHDKGGPENITLEYYDSVIAEILPSVLQQIRAQDKAKAMYEKLKPLVRRAVEWKAQEPKPTQDWTNLRIAEFETEATFARRRDQVRATEEELFQKKLEEYEQRADQIKAEVVQLMGEAKKGEADQTRFESEKANIQVRVRALPVCEMSVVFPVEIPYFDRSTMRFANISFDVPSDEISFKGDCSTLAEFQYLGARSVSIKAESLEAAQQFKHSARAGKIRIAFIPRPRYTGFQHPIVLKEAWVESRTTRVHPEPSIWEKAAQALAVAAVGADPNRVMEAVAEQNRLKTVSVAHPSETRDGVRLYIAMDCTSPRLMTTEGKPVLGVQLETKN